METNCGTLYGIGVGPGDPELLTLKAVNALKKMDVVFTASSTKNDFSLAKEIASPYLPEGTPVINLPFPMTKDQDVAIRAWEQNAERIMEEIKSGKNVAFLTLGDPLVYSTYGYIVASIKKIDPDTPIKTIPGITSFQAAASRVNTTLVQGDESLLLVAGTNGIHSLKKMTESIQNLVMLKAYKNISEITHALTDSSLDKRAIAVRKCGFPDEEVFFNLNDLANSDKNYWTLIMAKKEIEV